MQKISFGNKEYVKASVVAKKFRYTQDYVGQLCRGKKVDARLVGRVWYVEPESVVAYRKSKHTDKKDSSSVTIAFNKKVRRNNNPKPVSSVLRSKTLKSTQHPHNGVHTVQVNPVVYSSDTEVPIPILGKSNATQDNNNDNADAVNDVVVEEVAKPRKPTQKIKIKRAGSKQTKFTTEKLPEIALSGNLEIKESSDEIEYQPLKKEGELLNKSTPSPDKESRHVSVSADLRLKPEVAVAKNLHRQARSSHTAEINNVSVNSPQSVQSDSAVTNFFYSNWFLSTSFLLGVFSAIAILSLASMGEVSSNVNNSWSLFLNLQHIASLFEELLIR